MIQDKPLLEFLDIYPSKIGEMIYKHYLSKSKKTPNIMAEKGFISEQKAEKYFFKAIDRLKDIKHISSPAAKLAFLQYVVDLFQNGGAAEQEMDVLIYAVVRSRDTSLLTQAVYIDMLLPSQMLKGNPAFNHVASIFQIFESELLEDKLIQRKEKRD